MIFPAVVGDDQTETGFVRIKNVSGGALAVGDAVVLDITAPDGVRVSKPATATLGLLMGVLVAALANNGYGLAQCYGYSANVKVTNDTSVVVDTGNILVPVNGQTYFTRSGASDGKSGWVHYVDATFATATAGAVAAVVKKCLIRNL